jgi:hypothetical protein
MNVYQNSRRYNGFIDSYGAQDADGGSWKSQVSRYSLHFGKAIQHIISIPKTRKRLFF